MRASENEQPLDAWLCADHARGAVATVVLPHTGSCGSCRWWIHRAGSVQPGQTTTRRLESFSGSGGSCTHIKWPGCRVLLRQPRSNLMPLPPTRTPIPPSAGVTFTRLSKTDPVAVSPAVTAVDSMCGCIALLPVASPDTSGCPIPLQTACGLSIWWSNLAGLLRCPISAAWSLRATDFPTGCRARSADGAVFSTPMRLIALRLSADQ